VSVPKGRHYSRSLITALSLLSGWCLSFEICAQVHPEVETVAAFFSAIVENDTNTVARLLESNTNLVSTFYEVSKLPLLEAAAAGNVHIVRLLLKSGADINAQGDVLASAGCQNTALHFATQRNHYAVCEVLLEAGADPNLMAFGYMTPLHMAFQEHHADLANLLLDYGADPFREKGFSNDHSTPLEVAITQGSGMLVARMLGQDTKNPLGVKARVKPAASNRRRQHHKTQAEILRTRGEYLLAVAVQHGELEAVQAFLKAGVLVKADTEGGEPLIHAFSRAEAAAAKKENFSKDRWERIRELLVKNGLKYDVFAATALGDLEQAGHLFAVDKNVVRARDRAGGTPLHWAVEQEQPLLVHFWLQSGVLPAITNDSGQTALHLAAAKGQVNSVEALLAARTPLDTRDTNGCSALDAAIKARQVEVIRLLLKVSNPLLRPERGITTSLHEAAACGNHVALTTLLEKTSNLEARNELGLTPLQVAVRQGHLSAASTLVDKGADIRARDPDGNTLLHQILMAETLSVYDRPPVAWFERMGQDPRTSNYAKYLAVGPDEQGANPVLQAASFLLASGLDATATNNAGQTPIRLLFDSSLPLAVFLDSPDRILASKLLATRGGNVNGTDADGNTLLHMCGYGSSWEKVADLIAAGANVNATNHLGQTPLHKFAERIGGWDMNEGGAREPFRFLLKSGALVNAPDSRGLTALHVLASADTAFKEEAVDALIAAGANPNLKDRRGRTPVHLFLSGPWPWDSAGECLQKLARAGADFSIKDNEGKTPLHYLAALGDKRPLMFIRGIEKVFVTAEVDFQARDNQGSTPLRIAEKSGTRDVFDWLVKLAGGLDGQ
jgi:ankyrin repeat protein